MSDECYHLEHDVCPAPWDCDCECHAEDGTGPW